MKRFLLVLIISFSLASCKKSTSCNIESIDQLPWAVNLVSGKGSCIVYDSAKFYSYTFKGEQVFYFINMFSSNSNCTGGVYDCSGNKLSYDKDESDDFLKKRRNGKLLWQK